MRLKLNEVIGVTQVTSGKPTIEADHSPKHNEE
jgi:hypothetical protein